MAVSPLHTWALAGLAPASDNVQLEILREDPGIVVWVAYVGHRDITHSFIGGGGPVYGQGSIPTGPPVVPCVMGRQQRTADALPARIV